MYSTDAVIVLNNNHWSFLTLVSWLDLIHYGIYSWLNNSIDGIVIAHKLCIMQVLFESAWVKMMIPCDVITISVTLSPLSYYRGRSCRLTYIKTTRH